MIFDVLVHEQKELITPKIQFQMSCENGTTVFSGNVT